MQGNAICIFGFNVVNVSLLYQIQALSAWRVSSAAHTLTLITSVRYVSFTTMKRTSNNTSNTQGDR